MKKKVLFLIIGLASVGYSMTESSNIPPGEKIFEQNCATCHKLGGRGIPLSEMKKKYHNNKQALIERISKCRPAMALPEKERQEVINFITQ